LKAGLLLAAALGAVQLQAQEVHGRALAPESAVPVPGVIVTLVDSTGAVVDRALTTDAGRFRLRATRPSAYHLRALRIGFRPTETPAFALAAGEVVERSIELTGRSVVLAAVQVTADRSCKVRPDAGSAAYDAWEEARKALSASVLTRGLRYTMEMVRFDRRLDARAGAVLAESEIENRGTMSRPFVSVPLAQLDSIGYVHTDGEWTTYDAPDEEVLLSEQFAATHCLRLAEPASPDEVSLAFEPVGERNVTDIRGTLTLDRATGALRRLDFTYANVAREVERENAGGEILFRPLPLGGWIVYRWMMRFPSLERVVTQQPGIMSDVRGIQRRTESFRLRAMQESGGEVTEVARGDSILWQVTRPRLTGLVRDDSGTVIGGATVTIPTLGRRAVTHTDGRFAMLQVRRGRRSLQITTPLLDSLGLPPLARDADSRQSDEVVLTIPSRETLFATACGLPREEARETGFMRGITRGEHGERVGGVRIVATWFQPHGTRAETTLTPRNPGIMRTLETVSSATGDYTLCGVRVDQLITLRISPAGGYATTAAARVPTLSRILLMDLPVRTNASR
jgi:hypothetical protein